jgi:hypothetical protein
MKKTIYVAEILTEANRLLAIPNSKHTDEGFRRGVARMLEVALLATGNYHGYNFLGWVHGGCDAWEAAGKPEDRAPFIGDESRRIYYGSAVQPLGARGLAAPGLYFPKAL